MEPDIWRIESRRSWSRTRRSLHALPSVQMAVSDSTTCVGRSDNCPVHCSHRSLGLFSFVFLVSGSPKTGFTCTAQRHNTRANCLLEASVACNTRSTQALLYTLPQGYGTAANREDLLKILNRLNIDKDSELSALQSKLVRQIELAEKNRWPLEHDPRVNMVYSQTLREGLEDLEFRIRNHAVEHGVQVEETKHD